MKRKILAQIRIPSDLRFPDLKLGREQSGDLSYDRAVMLRVLAESGVPESAAADLEDLHSGVIIGWYRMHLQEGGAPDPVMEVLIAEEVEEQRGRAN